MAVTREERTHDTLGFLAWSLGLVLVGAVASALVEPQLYVEGFGDLAHRRVAYFSVGWMLASGIVEGAIAWGLAALARVAPSALARVVLSVGAAGMLVDAAIPVVANALGDLAIVRDDGARRAVTDSIVAVWPYVGAAASAGLLGGLALLAHARGRRRLAAFLAVAVALCVVDNVVLIASNLFFNLARWALRLLVPLVAAIVLRRDARPAAADASTRAWRRAGRGARLLAGAVATRVVLGLAAVGVLLHASGPPVEYEAIRLATAVFPVPIALLGIPLIVGLVRLARAPARGSGALWASAAVFTVALGVEARIAWLQAYEYLEGGMHGWIQRELDVVTLIAAAAGALGAVLFAVGLALFGDAVLRARALHLIAAIVVTIGVVVVAATAEHPLGLLLVPVAIWSAFAFALTISRAVTVCEAPRGS